MTWSITCLCIHRFRGGTVGVLTCACGCEIEISPLGLNGKPRRFIQGHQTKNRRTERTPAYWTQRVFRINARAGMCLCGCGEKVIVTLEWVKARASKSCVHIPRYLDGHMPEVSCGCGCGTLVPAFDEKHQPRSYVPAHAGKAAAGILKVDWEKRTRDWNTSAPLCGCGCGQRLVRSLTQLRAQYEDVKYLAGHNGRRACVTELSGVVRNSRFVVGGFVYHQSLSWIDSTFAVYTWNGSGRLCTA